MLRASVVVSTRNRSRLLDRCLAGVTTQRLPSDDFEVVVVDNGSTDGTGQVATRWAERCRNVRRESEPTVGLARARNTGVRSSRGEVVAFVDDDVVVDDGWLPALLGAYAAWSHVDAVVGPIRVTWPDARPAWLAPELERWFSGLDLGGERRVLDVGEMPFGANMSVRRDVLEEVGGFAVQLGRRGGDLISNDEKDLFTRLRDSGHAIAYEPAALVLHEVASHRLSRRWLARRAYAQGRSDVALERLQAARARRTPQLAAPTIRGLLGGAWGWVRLLGSYPDRDDRAGALAAQIVRQARAFGYSRETLVPSLTRKAR